MVTVTKSRIQYFPNIYENAKIKNSKHKKRKITKKIITPLYDAFVDVIWCQELPPYHLALNFTTKKKSPENV